MEYRPFYLAREWQRLGCEATIVAASFSHLRTCEPDVRSGLKEEGVEEVPYIWLRTPRYDGNGVRRACNMLAFTAQLFRYRNCLVEKCNPDVVITSSTYPLANVVAYYIAKRARAKLVYEVRDLWPLTLIELQGMSRWHPFVLLMQWAENFSYRKADRVTCTLPNAASHMVQHGMEISKFAYIPNGSPVNEWRQNGSHLPEEHRRVLLSLKAEGRFLLGYTGSHGVSNALSPFLDAAALLQHLPVAFVFVGQGSEKQGLMERALLQKLTNAVFLPPAPKSSMPALLGLLDGCFIGWQRKPFYRFGISPNKLLDYMMAGKPVIQAADAGGELVVKSSCGFSVPSESPAAIAEAVEKLMRLRPSDREAMGTRARLYVEAHHDYPLLARRYFDLFLKLTTPRQSVRSVLSPKLKPS